MAMSGGGGRRGSLERYIPPRRSLGGQASDQDSPNKSGGADWSAEVDLEDKMESLNMNGGGAADNSWKDEELSNWADEVDALSPLKEKGQPNFSNPPPNSIRSAINFNQQQNNSQQHSQQQYSQQQNYRNQHQRPANNLPPRFQQQNRQDQQTESNSYHQHQHKDQEWYQKLGRGRGRGNGARPTGGGGNQTNAQRLLSSRHQEREMNGGQQNGYNNTSGGYHKDQNGRKFADNGEDSDGGNSEASYSSKKAGGSDLRDRLNKRLKDVDRAHNSYNHERGNSAHNSHNQSNWQNNSKFSNNRGERKQEQQVNYTHNHDDRIENFVSDMRTSVDRQRENGHSYNNRNDRSREGSYQQGRDTSYHQRNDRNNRGDSGRPRSRPNSRQGDHGRPQTDHNKPSLPRPKKNTENFSPSHEAPEMRILMAPPGRSKYPRAMSSRDVVIVSDLFGSESDLSIYQNLMYELENSGVPENHLWQSWHGDSHLIADDKRRWKESCPTFKMVLDKLRDYFDMDIKATRLNWYRDTTEWKPFHHDAAALKPDKARSQNFTVAVSFGVERDAAFEHAATKTVIAMPQPNGTIYTFGKDVNILWRHGILQVPPEQHTEEGRISIIAWGWIKQYDL